MRDKATRAVMEYVNRTRVVQAPPTLLGTVTGVGAAGVQVAFDGDVSATTKNYKTVVGCDVGDRVLLARIGKGHVVVGTIRTGPVIQAANTVVTTSGAGIGSILFPAAYPAAPVVVVNAYDVIYHVRQVVPSASGFTFEARNSAGALMLSTAVRVGWIAHPAT